jgi:two-component system cell cycle sensor histidine kinase/response regulator CckA
MAQDESRREGVWQRCARGEKSSRAWKPQGMRNKCICAPDELALSCAAFRAPFPNRLSSRVSDACRVPRMHFRSLLPPGWWRAAWLLLALAGALRAVAQEPPTNPEERTLLVGITWPEPRYVPADQAHQLDRFEAELAVAVARLQGMKISFRLAPLDQLLAELADGRVDFMPGLARTPERLKSFDFTVPHNRMTTNLFVRKDNRTIYSAADLPGRDVIVIANGYSNIWAAQHAEARRLVIVPDLTEALRHLARGDGDVLVVKQINLYAAMRDAGVNDVEMRGPPVPGLTQDLCFAVRAGNRDLLARLNEATFTLKQSGELDQIYTRWIGTLDGPPGFFSRYRRGLILGGSVALVLLAIAGSLYRMQLRRARGHVAEIEHRVTERTEELAAAKARFEEVVACTPTGIVIIDPHDAEAPGRIVDCNELFCRMHGYAKAELLRSSINRLMLAPYDLKTLAVVAAEIESGRRRHGQTRHRRKDGTLLEVEFYSTFIRLDGRNLVLIVNLDITDRLRAETALRRTEEFQRLVLRATNDGIFEWDISGDRFYLSDRGWQMLGYAENELSGSRLGWWLRLHPDDVQDAEATLWRHFIEGAPFVHTGRYLHKDGSVRWLYCRAHTLRDAAGQPVRMVGSYTDITELKRIDGELQLTRRLRAIGELVGGIAHEFNNLLTPILLRASEVSQRDDMPPAVVTELQPVLDAARRAQTLTQQLLQFGRRGNVDLISQPLASVVESTLQLMRSTVDRRIDIRAECDRALPPLQHNTAIMGQVVMNLVLNARDALLE